MSALWLAKNVCICCPHLDYCHDRETCEAFEVLRRFLKSDRVSTKDIGKVIAE